MKQHVGRRGVGVGRAVARHWLAVEPWEEGLGRVATGAVVTVRAGESARIRTVGGGSGYLSSSPALAHFGLGELTRVDGIDVKWPDGAEQSFGPSEVDRTVRLVRKRVP